MTPEKAEFQRPASEGVTATDFAQAVQLIRPTAIVGAAGKRGSISQEAIVALLKVALATRCLPGASKLQAQRKCVCPRS